MDEHIEGLEIEDMRKKLAWLNEYFAGIRTGLSDVESVHRADVMYLEGRLGWSLP